MFMPIATKGAVKTLSVPELHLLGAQVILANTYHLMLRPGAEDLRTLGGLHTLMGWTGPILTDSGGYQVFSLSKLNKIGEEGVEFQSHLDGSRHLLTSERSMEIQEAIGSDIRMVFDDVAAGDSPRVRYEEAMERSLRWAQRSKNAFGGEAQLFGIVQGGTHEDLRERSVAGLREIGFDGYAIGGLSVGEGREDTYRLAKFTAGLLPGDQPRYFMGGGKPEEIVYYVGCGIDLFDCVLPTRNARHGTLYVWNQDPETWMPVLDTEVPDASFYSKLVITNESFRLDQRPLDPFCDGPCCVLASRAYLRHLFQTQEMLGLHLATQHNVRFYLRLMERLRSVIH